MKIRKTTEKDVECIMEIYAYARKFMSDHGNPNQWGTTNWPPNQLILDDIKVGKSYVCINDIGNIIGTFCLNWAYDQCRHLKIDTHENNIIMQRLLTKLGFERRGIIYVREDHYPRIAFEKQQG